MLASLRQASAVCATPVVDRRYALTCALLICVHGAGAQTASNGQGAQSAMPAAVTPAPNPGKPAPAVPRNLPNRFAGRAGAYYRYVWGVDMLSVKRAESGEMIRFSWRVLDAERAKALNEKSAAPSLEDPQAGVSLVVPALENIGMMRQSQNPVAGKSYWMAFSNKGRFVKPGDRVNVVIGQFRADGLVVD